MELQLLVILAVALIVFGPEKMLQFATELGKWVRKIKQEWAQIQMELEMEELKKKLDLEMREGEEKVKKYFSGEVENKTVSQAEIMNKVLGDNKGEKSGGEVKPSQLSMEDLVSGKAPIVDDETKSKSAEGTKS
jgi:Sec-independent protein translocase protein TatA